MFKIILLLLIIIYNIRKAVMSHISVIHVVVLSWSVFMTLQQTSLRE